MRGGGARRDLWTTTKLPDYAETDTVVALLQVSRLVRTKRVNAVLVMTSKRGCFFPDAFPLPAMTPPPPSW